MFNLPTLLAFTAILSQITPGGREPAPRQAVVQAPPSAPVRYQAAIAPVIASSLGTYPDARKRFLDGLPRKTYLLVSVRLGGNGGPCALAVVKVSDIDEKKGLVIGSATQDVKGHFAIRQGDDVNVHESDVIDWEITHPDGSIEGNAVGNYIASLGAGVDTADVLMDQRDKDLLSMERSKAVENAINQTFLEFFGDKDLKIEAAPSASAPASNEWPSLAVKYRDTAPAALVTELKARAAAVKATRKVTVEAQGKDLVVVTAYVVLRKGDLAFEVTQSLQFSYPNKKALERVTWGLSDGRWISMAPKAG